MTRTWTYIRSNAPLEYSKLGIGRSFVTIGDERIPKVKIAGDTYRSLVGFDPSPQYIDPATWIIEISFIELSFLATTNDKPKLLE